MDIDLTPEGVPDISREQLAAALAALGFEPGKVRELHLTPGCCQVELWLNDDYDLPRSAGKQLASVTLRVPVAEAPTYEAA